MCYRSWIWTYQQVIQNLENNTKLQTLDLAGNRIKTLEGLGTLTELEEFWFNDNQLEDWSQLNHLSKCQKLSTVYLERNPIQNDVNYRRKIKLVLPSLTQIDATLCRWNQYYISLVNTQLSKENKRELLHPSDLFFSRDTCEKQFRIAVCWRTSGFCQTCTYVKRNGR